MIDLVPIRFKHEESGLYIELTDSSKNTWKIVDDFRYVLSRSGKMVYEPLPSNRTEKFIQSIQFNSLEEAKNALYEYLGNENEKIRNNT